MVSSISVHFLNKQTVRERISYDILPAWCMYGMSGGGDFPLFVMVDAQTGDFSYPSFCPQLSYYLREKAIDSYSKKKLHIMDLEIR